MLSARKAGKPSSSRYLEREMRVIEREGGNYTIFHMEEKVSNDGLLSENKINVVSPSFIKSQSTSGIVFFGGEWEFSGISGSTGSHVCSGGGTGLKKELFVPKDISSYLNWDIQ